MTNDQSQEYLAMQHIIVESTLEQKLCGSFEQAVLCDDQGRVIGFFSPLQNRPQLSDLQLEPPLSIEETEQLRKNRAGRPLDEILARLGY